ncbi:DyP-type peroxidase [Auriculariales sp. MPI-PUGE-AT-0066]|nr:DyP-type peroxidase [Auriculariales sp. MPI-PUGE-AT-0066]
MRKKLELFYFFQIDDTAGFKNALHNSVVDIITPTKAMLSTATQPQVAVNLAFSQTGLNKLGITGNLNDTTFSAGQASDADFLGDPSTTNWKSVFKSPSTLHGVFLIASDDQTKIDTMVTFLESTFGSSQHNLYKLQGNVRPAPFEGHEQFGYMDGIAQPAVRGFNIFPHPGQLVVPAGIILTGETGDNATRPAWTKDGSFLAFRELQQLVPEFDKFVADKAAPFDNFTASQSAELFGARIVGRWKSGAPVDLAPRADDPTLAADPDRNNNFDYSHPPADITSDQSRCPFHAHIRKSRPRADLSAPRNTIMRAGIPYGPEVTTAERSAQASNLTLERGLAFVSYQSRIADGFQFLQHNWLNNPGFIFGKNVDPGHEPLVGANQNSTRFITGADINNPTALLNITQDFIVSRGGEYFFSPSISAIRNTISV